MSPAGNFVEEQSSYRGSLRVMFWPFSAPSIIVGLKLSQAGCLKPRFAEKTGISERPVRCRTVDNSGSLAAFNDVSDGGRDYTN